MRALLLAAIASCSTAKLDAKIAEQAALIEKQAADLETDKELISKLAHASIDKQNMLDKLSKTTEWCLRDWECMTSPDNKLAGANLLCNSQIKNGRLVPRD